MLIKHNAFSFTSYDVISIQLICTHLLCDIHECATHVKEGVVFGTLRQSLCFGILEVELCMVFDKGLGIATVRSLGGCYCHELCDSDLNTGQNQGCVVAGI